MHITTQLEDSAYYYSDSEPRASDSTYSFHNTFLPQLCLKLVEFDVEGRLNFFLILSEWVNW